MTLTYVTKAFYTNGIVEEDQSDMVAVHAQPIAIWRVLHVWHCC